MALDFQFSDKVRFMKFVQIKQDDHWMWTGATDKDGYGVFTLRYKYIRAHRASWLFFKGPIPEGKHVLHKCDIPGCVRPDDLFLGTNLDNSQDMMRKGRHRSGMMLHPECAAKGEAHGNAKLTDEIVREMRRRYVPRKVTFEQLAKEFDVSIALVHNVVHGDGWRHVI